MNPLYRRLGRVKSSLGFSLEALRGYPPNAVLLTSFPKSGNTWVRFIAANMARESMGRGPEVDFHTVSGYAPELQRDSVRRAIVPPRLPVLLKTHSPWRRVWKGQAVLLVIREPGDVMVSYHRYLEGEQGFELPPLARFVRSEEYGIPAWKAFHRSWIGHVTAVLRYESLIENTVPAVIRAWDLLGYPVPQGLAEVAVARSSKEVMRRLREERGDPCGRNPDFPFVRKGEVGESKRVLDEATRRYIREETAELVEFYRSLA
ncbi:MAG TPA: hypothetical protein ENK54_06440 [Thiotrichales bacterium]|nr:hypothetical protein [Thiotrichales bacterium]